VKAIRRKRLSKIPRVRHSKISISQMKSENRIAKLN
jgi:hypothetical protein